MKFKRKLLFCFAVVSMISLNTLNSYAKLPVEYGNFTVNGKTTKLALAELVIDGQPINKATVGVDPVTINSRTLVPVRALSEKLGYKVTWIETAKKVTIEDANKKIELFIGKTNAKIDNKDTQVTDSVAPMIINSSTYVPIRFVVENMGLDIDYDAKLNKISLNSSQKKASEIAETLFDEKETPSKHIANVPESPQTPPVQNNAQDDPSIPKDVDRFIDNTKTPEVEKPKEPEKPLPPTTIAPSETVPPSVITPITTPNEPKYELTADFVKEQNDIVTISQNYGEINVNYFYLSDPRRLVVDVKNGKLSDYESSERQWSGDVFLSLKSQYHSDGNYTRFVIALNDSVKNDELKIDTSSSVFRVQKINIIKQGEEFTYNFGRKTGSLSMKTVKNIEIQNLSDDSSMILLEIPKDSIKLNTGNLNVSNRIVKSINIAEEDGKYKVKISLGDRVVYSIKKTSSNITDITFNKQDREPPRIVVDPGHGGKDPGAINYKHNISEKELNIQVGLKLKQKLQDAGYEVYMTREDDKFIPLNDIAKFSNNYDADIFISIHHNSADNRSANGIETHYYGGADSKKLADTIHKYIQPESRLKNRGVKNSAFVVVKKTTSPAILMELGFVSNDAEVQKIMSQDYQDRVTSSIILALNEYFGR